MSKKVVKPYNSDRSKKEEVAENKETDSSEEKGGLKVLGKINLEDFNTKKKKKSEQTNFVKIHLGTRQL